MDDLDQTDYEEDDFMDEDDGEEILAECLHCGFPVEDPWPGVEVQLCAVCDNRD